MRITNNIYDIPYKLRFNALSLYLSKIYNNSKDDFEYCLVKYSNSINHYSSDKSILALDSDKVVKYDSELSNNILLRSLSDDKIPFHICQIPRLKIKEAINKLNNEYFVLIMLIIDSDISFKEKELNQIKDKINKLNDRKYFYLKKKVMLNLISIISRFNIS